MVCFSFFSRSCGEHRFFWLSVVACFLMCVISPCQAEKVADGTVNFTGTMLGAQTFTLRTASSQYSGTVELGNILSGDVVSRNVPAQVKHIEQVKVEWASGDSVKMSVNFDSVEGDNTLIKNQGTAQNVAGVLTCPTDAQGINCTSGYQFGNGDSVTGQADGGIVTFPLAVSLVSTGGKVTAGSVYMQVHLVFEEL